MTKNSIVSLIKFFFPQIVTGLIIAIVTISLNKVSIADLYEKVDAIDSDVVPREVVEIQISNIKEDISDIKKAVNSTNEKLDKLILLNK